jgi:hypothetical protein
VPRTPGGRQDAGRIVGARTDWSGGPRQRETRLTGRNAFFGLGVIGSYGLVFQTQYLPVSATDTLGTSDVATRKIATAVVREFDGVDDRIVVGPGAVGQLGTAAFTVLLVIQPLFFFYEYPLTIYAANGDILGALNLDGGDNTIHWNTSFGGSGSPFAADTSWQLLAVTKAASGFSMVRFHRAPLGGAWTHADSAAQSGPTGLPSQIIFGSTATPDLWQQMRLAVAAIWNRGLSDAELDSITGATAQIQAVSGGVPDALWEFNQPDVSIPVLDMS